MASLKDIRMEKNYLTGEPQHKHTEGQCWHAACPV
jgi:hypothetical protein